MPTVHVSLGDRSYDILVEDGLLDQTSSLIDSISLTGKAAIITDSNVAPHYADRLLKQLPHASLHTIPAGEGSKSMAVAAELCSELNQAGHDRSSFIIALAIIRRRFIPPESVLEIFSALSHRCSCFRYFSARSSAVCLGMP